MKTLMKFLAAFFFFAFVTNTTFAQTQDKTNCDGTGVPVQLQKGSGSGLHGAGNGVMSQLRKNGGVFQTAFKATLTEEQLAIIENLELTRQEKREALWATFSEAQQEMYNNHMAEVAARQARHGGKALHEGQLRNAVKNGWQKGRN